MGHTVLYGCPKCNTFPPKDITVESLPPPIKEIIKEKNITLPLRHCPSCGQLWGEEPNYGTMRGEVQIVGILTLPRGSRR